MVKVALILFLAHFLTQKVNHIREIRQGLLIPLGVTGVMVGLILLQPDFGTTVIIAVITFMMIYLAGGRIVHLARDRRPVHPRGRLASRSTRATAWPG